MAGLSAKASGRDFQNEKDRSDKRPVQQIIFLRTCQRQLVHQRHQSATLGRDQRLGPTFLWLLSSSQAIKSRSVFNQKVDTSNLYNTLACQAKSKFSDEKENNENLLRRFSNYNFH